MGCIKLEHIENPSPLKVVLGKKLFFPKSSAGAYRYGFNGMEKDDEHTQGKYDFGARIYDSRLGRWLAVDPHFKNYSGYSPYNFALNNPIYFIDPDGRTIYDKDGKKVVIEYVEDGIVIVNEASIDPDLVSTIKAVWNESIQGVNTIHELDCEDIKVQVIPNDKIGVWDAGEIGYGVVAGLTSTPDDLGDTDGDGDTDYGFIDADGETYNARVSLFHTSKSRAEIEKGIKDGTITEEDVVLVDGFGEYENSPKYVKKALKKIAKNGFAGNDNHEATNVALNGLSTSDSKLLDEVIDPLTKTDKLFDWTTTLIHENVHAQGDKTEDEAYQKEIDSFKDSGRAQIPPTKNGTTK